MLLNYVIIIIISAFTHTHVGTRAGSIVSVLVYSLKSLLLDHFFVASNSLDNSGSTTKRKSFRAHAAAEETMRPIEITTDFI